MASLTEAELKKAIKEDAPGQLYYLYGNEKFLIKLYYDKLVEKIAGKHPSDFSFHTFRTLDNIDQIAVATGAVPFMGGRNFVGIADADASKLSDGEFSKLMELLENIPQGTAVVVAQLTANPDMGKAKNKKLLAALTKLGNAVQLNKMGEIALQKQLVTWALKRGAALNQADAGRIVSYCGTDLQNLRNELDKLCAFTDNGEITREAIEQVVVKNFEARVFDLSKYVVTGDCDNAYRQLDQLFYQREEPISILAVLSSTYVDMYRVRAVIESGGKAQDAAGIYDYKRKEFRLNQAERYAKKLPTQALRDSLSVLAETDELMKSTPRDNALLLQELIAKLLMISKKEYPGD